MTYKEQYEFWCTSSIFDQETKEELIKIANDESEIEDRFYKNLVFGTGGLRGVMGAGTNRMNRYTVQKASQGLANVVIEEKGQEKGIAIAYDSRNHSAEFALDAAGCFVANGIKTYLFDDLRPTPELSFAVRQLGCMAGVVITASHNPSEYNGYKVYWQDGAQITAPKDAQIMKQVNDITDYDDIKTMPLPEVVKNPLFTLIGEEVDQAYMAELKKLVLNPDAIEKCGKDLTIVYTPLHGTGNLPVRRILKELGFEHVYVVEEQALPDGNFPTVAYPNPEEPAVFELALELAKKVNADLILATDPDADRLGVYVPDGDNHYQLLNGNMSGSLLCEYELSQKKKMGLLKDHSAVVSTIVTTNMANAIAKHYHVACLQTLTGFKYIGEQIHLFEQKGSYTYEFGYEESYGCLIGTYARDKDAVVAVMALCEAAAYYKLQGKTLWEQLLSMYESYGYYKEDLATKTCKGIDGAVQIKTMVETFRTNIPTHVAGMKVLRVSDFATGDTIYHLPKSNVIYYDLEDDAWFAVRPSGTEPKIKFYFGVKGTSLVDAQERLKVLKQAVMGEGANEK